MSTYNGHKNWNHWNVSLWIGNDEGLYRHAVDLLKRFNVLAATRHFMRQVEGDKTPDGAPYSYSSVHAALAGLEIEREN